MANNFGKGIKVTSGFDLSAQAPLDNRTVVDTLSERDAHITNNRAYLGLRVFVTSEKKEYLYDGTGWVEAGGMTDEQVAQLVVAYAHSMSEHASKEVIDEEFKKVLDKINALPTKEMVDSKSDASHNHDDKYYSMDDIDQKLLEIVAGGVIDLESYAKKADVEIAMATKSEVGHGHSTSDIEGLVDALAEKANVSDVAKMATKEEVQSKADAVHNHDDNYYTKDQVDNIVVDAVTNGQVDLSGYAKISDLAEKADASHTHTITEVEGLTDSLYSKEEIDDKISTINEDIKSKADTVHNHDDVYYTQSEVDDRIIQAVTDGQVDLSDYARISDLAEKADAYHIHTFSDIEGLDENIYTKDEINNAISELKEDINSRAEASHEHSDVYAKLDHEHSTENISDLFDNVYSEKEVDNLLSAKSEVGHNHDDNYYTQAQVDDKLSKVLTDGQLSLESYATKKDLTDGLSAKSDVGHGHTPSDIEGLDDLFENSYSKEEVDQAIIVARTEAMAHADASIANLVDSAPDAMNTLNELAQAISTHQSVYEAYVNTVSERLSSKSDVDHAHNDIYYTKDQVQELIDTGIGGVDLSNLALKSELKEGLDGKSDLGHGHEISEIKNLQEELDVKINIEDAASKEDLSALEEALSGKADSNHSHDYAGLEHTHTAEEITDLSESYYNKDEMDVLLSAKSEAGHNHNDNYYTKNEVDNKIEAGITDANLSQYATVNYVDNRMQEKADLVHTHTVSDIENLQDELDLKANKSDVAMKEDLGSYSPIDHNHDDKYCTPEQVDEKIAAVDHSQYAVKTEVEEALGGKSDSNHAHDDRYYTQETVDQKIQAGVDSVDLSGLATKAELKEGLDKKAELVHEHDYAKIDHEHTIDNITDLFEKVYDKDEIDNALAEKSGIDHVHGVEEIKGLREELDLKADIATTATKKELEEGLASKSNSDHIHDDLYSRLEHIHAVKDITDLFDNVYNKDEIDDALAEYSPLGHIHSISEITELQNELDSKIDVSIAATKAELQAGLNGKAELVHEHDDTYSKLEHDHAGLYLIESEIDSKIDVAKSAAVTEAETLAQIYINEKISELLGGEGEGAGPTTLAGLNAALNLHKQEFETYKSEVETDLAGKADSVHIHDMSDVTGLENALESKANVSDVNNMNANLSDAINDAITLVETSAQNYTNEKIAELVNGAPDAMNTLNELAQAIQSHQSVYEAYVETVSTALASKSDVSHTHNNIYYTKEQVEDLISDNIGDIDFSSFATKTDLAGKADSNHNHDDKYSSIDHKHNLSEIVGVSGDLYNKEEIDNLLANKADSNHSHANDFASKEHDHTVSDVTDLFDNVYSEDEVDTLLANKSDSNHHHDSRYYLKYQVDAKIAGIGIGNYATLEDLQTWATLFALKEHNHDGLLISLEDTTIQNMLITIFGFYYGQPS